MDECLSCSHISVALDLIRGLGDMDILTSCHDVGWNHTDSARTQQWIPLSAWTCCQVLEDDRYGQVCDTGPAAGGQINVLAFRMVKTVQTGIWDSLGNPKMLRCWLSAARSAYVTCRGKLPFPLLLPCQKGYLKIHTNVFSQVCTQQKVLLVPSRLCCHRAGSSG